MSQGNINNKWSNIYCWLYYSLQSAPTTATMTISWALLSPPPLIRESTTLFSSESSALTIPYSHGKMCLLALKAHPMAPLRVLPTRLAPSQQGSTSSPSATVDPETSWFVLLLQSQALKISTLKLEWLLSTNLLFWVLRTTLSSILSAKRSAWTSRPRKEKPHILGLTIAFLHNLLEE